MDNTRYINTKTWEISNSPEGFIPADKGIVKTICILNKKGYITFASCEGHSNIQFDDEVNVDIKYLDEFKNDPRVIIKEIRDDSFDYWGEIYGNSIYVAFHHEYEFESIPEGFELEDGHCLRHMLKYYDDKLKRRSTHSINEEIKKYNKILYEWANRLPDNKER